MKTRTYIAIDLKSFYASVECVERGLNPLETNLVVADESRTSKTICLAVSPALKSFGVPGRPRLFEVEQEVGRLNAARARKAPEHKLATSSPFLGDLMADPTREIGYLVAPPRMALYVQYSTRIYQIYLKYVSPEDVHVYSIDEVFIDVTGYLKTYHTTAHDLTLRMIRDVLAETGITATAGIGTNLYLAKVAMDVMAKHQPADADGVRIAELDELSYRQLFWGHKPITDFWRVGSGTARRLRRMGVYTMGDVALLSTTDEELLYKEFGINAELLIDHAWGYESCTLPDIKAFKPASTSLSSGQVLSEPYTFAKARVVMQEMADALVLDMTQKGVMSDSVVVQVGYEQLSDAGAYAGEVVRDYYGRMVPKPAGGSVSLPRLTRTSTEVVGAALAIFDAVVDRTLMVRRLNVAVGRLVPDDQVLSSSDNVQLDLFGEVDAARAEEELRARYVRKEEAVQGAMVDVKAKFGKNALLKGTNFAEGATGRERNRQIGGHKA